MKTIIEQYIQFAEQNGFDIHIDVNFQYYGINLDLMEYGFTYCEYVPYKDIITSKPFIEAIARGCKYIDLNKLTNKDMYGWSDCEKITFLQSSAIRDVKLEEFITNLGILGQ